MCVIESKVRPVGGDTTHDARQVMFNHIKVLAVTPLPREPTV